jgi:hypothetical protein
MVPRAWDGKKKSETGTYNIFYTNARKQRPFRAVE